MEVEELKEVIDLVFERLRDEDVEIRKSAAFALKKTVRESTGTVTSIPQAIKYLKERIVELFKIQEEFSAEEAGQHIADVLSIVCLTYPSQKGPEGENIDPVDLVLAGTPHVIIMWGLEFQRMMTIQVARAFNPPKRSQADSIEESERRDISKRDFDKLKKIVVLSVDSLMTNGFIQDALDVLIEAGILAEKINDYAIPEDDGHVSPELYEEREAASRERTMYIRGIEKELAAGINAKASESKTTKSAMSSIEEEVELKKEHLVIQSNVLRIAHYLTETALVSPPGESVHFFQTVFDFLISNEEYLDALRIALRLHHGKMVLETLNSIVALKKNRDGLLIQAFIDIVNSDRNTARSMYQALQKSHDDLPEILEKIVSRQLFGTMHSYSLAQYENSNALKVEDLMKLHLEEIKFTNTVLSSSMLRKADILASGFANAASASDALLTVEKSAILMEKGSHKDFDIELAAFMHGALNLWTGIGGANIMTGLMNNPTSAAVRTGGLAGMGACFAGVEDIAQPMLAIARNHCHSTNPSEKIAAIVALSMAYAGSCNEAVSDILMELTQRNTNMSKPGDEDGSQETKLKTAKNEFSVVCHACLALGLVWTGSMNEDVLYHIVEVLQSWSEPFMIRVSCTRMALCGIGCLFTGRGDESIELMGSLAEMELFPNSMLPFLVAVAHGYAYVSSNNVSIANDLLAQIAETHATKVQIHKEASEKKILRGEADDKEIDEEKKEADEKQKLLREVAANQGENVDILSLASQATVSTDIAARESEQLKYDLVEPLCDESVAMVAIGLIANSDETGVQVSRRILDRALQFGSTSLIRGCPWAYAALYPSDPSVVVMEALDRLTVSDDLPTACNALVASGLVGFGSANSRLISSLRKHIAKFSYISAHVACSEIAVGLLFAGRSSARIRTSCSEQFVPSILSSAAYATYLFCMCNDWNLSMPISNKPPMGTRRTIILDEPMPTTMVWALLLLSMESRASISISEDGTPLTTKVRVGNYEEGSRTGVTGAQTSKTPAMVAPKERVVAVEGAWKPYGRILDNIFVCKEDESQKAPEK